MGGQWIRTTGEHPFYVEDKGWLAVHEMVVGDCIYCAWMVRQSKWSKLVETSDWEQVYNVRIADSHTYFIETQEWGFATWAHNANFSSKAIQDGGPLNGL